METLSGEPLFVNMVPTDFALFDLFGLEAIAERISPIRGADTALADERGLIFNATGIAGMGFESPQAAIGQTLTLSWGPDNQPRTFEIVGVVPDFSLRSIDRQIVPTMYYALDANPNIIDVKLSGRDIPETLTAIDRIWDATVADGPIDRFFVSDHIQSLYIGILRQAQAFGVFAFIAVLLACIGLRALCALSVENRIKEIGVRKAMGAASGDIFQLLT